jgi:tetratricopeptide (TPR) repeat protein
MVPSESWEELYESGEKALDRSDYKLAEASLLSALQATHGDTDKQFMTFDALEELYEEQKNYSASEKILLTSLDLMRTLHDYPGNMIGAAYQKLAQANFFMGRLKTADEYAQAAIPMIKDSCGAESPEAAVALNNLGWVESGTNKLGLAETHFRQSLYIITRTIGEHTVLYGMVANNLARVYVKAGNEKGALLWFQRSSAALHDSLGSDDSFAQDVAVECPGLQPAARHHRHVKAKSHTSNPQ